MRAPPPYFIGLPPGRAELDSVQLRSHVIVKLMAQGACALQPRRRSVELSTRRSQGKNVTQQGHHWRMPVGASATLRTPS